MKAMVLPRIVSLNEVATPLEAAELPVPEPERGEILIRVAACGVCHTELDEIEGRSPPPTLPVVLGHEIVGHVDRAAPDVSTLRVGDRVGVGWIHHSSGDEYENLDPAFTATGRDVNGGYAEYMTVGEDYAYVVPDAFTDVQAAPLLCAGAVGYRALTLAAIADGDALGLTGFGGSAHLVLQLARHLYPRSRIFVFARDEAAQRFARELGAVWAGHTTERAPVPLHAIIDTTPAWTPVVEALRNLRPGGRLVVNAIRKEANDQDALLDVSYHDHLWMEKEIKSVANVTQHDIRAFLPLAAEAGIRPEVEVFPLANANRALVELKRQPVRGAKVLSIPG